MKQTADTPTVPATLQFHMPAVVKILHADMEDKEKAYLAAKEKVLTIMTYELHMAGYGGRNDIHTQLKLDDTGLPYMDVTPKEEPQLVAGEPIPLTQENQ